MEASGGSSKAGVAVPFVDSSILGTYALRDGLTYVLAVYNSDSLYSQAVRYSIVLRAPSDTAFRLQPYMIAVACVGSVLLTLFLGVYYRCIPLRCAWLPRWLRTPDRHVRPGLALVRRACMSFLFA